MLLGIPPKQYRYVMNEPWNYLTVKQMEKIAYLVDKPLLDIFFACSKRPYKDIAHDIEKLRVAAALERSGIT